MTATRVQVQPGRHGGERGSLIEGNRRLTLPPWSAPAALCALTALGFAIRLVNLNQGLFGDELSTAWIVHGHRLGRVISLVYSDDEITPPLSFILAWLSSKLGSSWEWLRLPSLLAGTATIPLVYATGARTAGRAAGLLAAAVTALSAVMIMFSTEARNYAVMMAFVAASTLSMLLALDTRRARWWGAYALTSCLAMYSHYSAVFVLIAQFAWLLWRHPAARRPALLANVAAAAVYAPWIPGVIKDTHSVTVPILNALVRFTPSFVLHSVAEWAVGYPYLTIRQAPGMASALLVVGGVVLAALAVLVRAISRFRRRAGVSLAVSDRVVLLMLLAVATLAGEAIFSAFGSHVLDSRDLNASWPALAVVIGVVVSGAGRIWGGVSCALVLAGYGIAAADTLQPKWQRPQYPAVARFISRHARRGDVVLDASNVPVVPLTPLDAYLPQDHPEFRLALPEGPPPYTLLSRVPPTPQLVARAVRVARGRRIFLVAGSYGQHTVLSLVTKRPPAQSAAGGVLAHLPHGYRVEQTVQFPGIEELTVSVIALPHSQRSPP